MSERKTEILVKELASGWVEAASLCTMLDWSPHTLRGAISKLNTVASNSGEGKRIEHRRASGVTSYRIATSEPAL